jgi:hypothetical protein
MYETPDGAPPDGTRFGIPPALTLKGLFIPDPQIHGADMRAIDIGRDLAAGEIKYFAELARGDGAGARCSSPNRRNRAIPPTGGPSGARSGSHRLRRGVRRSKPEHGHVRVSKRELAHELLAILRRRIDRAGDLYSAREGRPLLARLWTWLAR